MRQHNVKQQKDKMKKSKKISLAPLNFEEALESLLHIRLVC